jgi:hypothetical protein
MVDMLVTEEKQNQKPAARTGRPSQADLWIHANRCYVFLRDEHLETQLYFLGNGEMEIVPCTKIRKEAVDVRFHAVKRFYAALLKKHGYKK